MVFKARQWDRKSKEDLIKSSIPCHDAQVAGLRLESSPARLTVLAARSVEHCTTTPSRNG